jgi:hypothetical protein
MKTRRDFIKQASAGIGAISLPDILRGGFSAPAATKKIVCVGGHPDDPESGCGGTLAKLAAQGHAVTIIYLTTGEAGINGASQDTDYQLKLLSGSSECIKSAQLLWQKRTV